MTTEQLGGEPRPMTPEAVARIVALVDAAATYGQKYDSMAKSPGWEHYTYSDPEFAPIENAVLGWASDVTPEDAAAIRRLLAGMTEVSGTMGGSDGVMPIRRELWSEDGARSLGAESAVPRCGEDFCDQCGDCLACYRDDPCPSGAHRWISYLGEGEGTVE